MATSGPEKESEHLPRPGEGISQVIGKIFDQLSLSAWLPAAMLVGAGSLLLQLRAQSKLDVGAALIALTKQPLGILIVVLFSLVLATLVVQAFEFEVIRVLEGYWGTSRPAMAITEKRIRAHLKRRSKLAERITTARRMAFATARQRMIAEGVQRDLVDILEMDVLGRAPAPFSKELVAEARSMGWRYFAMAYDLRVIDANVSRLSTYPQENRVMPTRLGNTLRAAEDSLELPDRGDLQGFVLRNYGRISRQLMTQQSQFRTRLDMYCSLLLVFILLSATGLVTLWKFDPWHLPAATACAGFALMAVLSYGAAISSASGYGSALKAIDGEVAAKIALDRQDGS